MTKQSGRKWRRIMICFPCCCCCCFFFFVNRKKKLRKLNNKLRFQHKTSHPDPSAGPFVCPIEEQHEGIDPSACFRPQDPSSRPEGEGKRWKKKKKIKDRVVMLRSSDRSPQRFFLFIYSSILGSFPICISKPPDLCVGIFFCFFFYRQQDLVWDILRQRTRTKERALDSIRGWIPSWVVGRHQVWM